MPDDAVDALVARIQSRQATKSISPALARELEETKALGITDGSSPQGLATRAQAAIMALRVVKPKAQDQ